MKRYVRSGKAPEKTEAFFNASAEELRVLALILSRDEPISAEDIETGARLDGLGDAKDALAFWRGAGLIKTAVAKKEATDAAETVKSKKKPVRSADELPEYSDRKSVV